MPFTPFHLGVGALAKAVAPRRFSFAVFAVSQVAMDIEPLVKLLGLLEGRLHGVTHTVTGAMLIAAATALFYLAWQRYGPDAVIDRIGRSSAGIVAVSAIFGALSHIGLDALMHRDMALHVQTSVDPHMLCLGAAALAAVVALVRHFVGSAAATTASS
jgi:hypothetical protein